MSLTVGGLGVTVQQNDVLRLVQPLVAGNNVLTHNFGFAPVEVQIFNNITGAIVTFTVVAESSNSVTIFVPMAVAMVRINLDS
jgi:hypothetical protein